MAEPAIALREHPQIIELFTVLEQNGLHQQKDEVQALVSYIDGIPNFLSCFPSCLMSKQTRRFESSTFVLWLKTLRLPET